tara:strand:- start:141 stop:428 length:288 start_codon:yes stop_codon:yes gene_type:complete
MSIAVLGCNLDVNIAGSSSLKDKRRVIQSLKDRLKRDFNLALAEVGAMNEWQRAEIAIVTVSNDIKHANSVISKAVNLVENNIYVELIDYKIERL